MTGPNKDSANKDSKVNIITVPNILRQKIGTGGIDGVKLKLAQNKMDGNTVDFAPYAHKFLDDLDHIVARAKTAQVNDRPTINTIIKPIMELKANGGMFKYTLLSQVAEIVLSLLEDIQTLNDDSYALIDAHQKALRVIINNRLTGDGGKDGRILANALYDAAQRYRKKYRVK